MEVAGGRREKVEWRGSDVRGHGRGYTVHVHINDHLNSN
jgi:hypothetical protein